MVPFEYVISKPLRVMYFIGMISLVNCVHANVHATDGVSRGVVVVK